MDKASLGATFKVIDTLGLVTFLYFNEFLFCYVLHFFTHWPFMNTYEKYRKKENKTKNIYIADSHTLHTITYW